MNRNPGRRATDKPPTTAEIVASHGGSFTAAQLFTALDGIQQCREALDMVLHQTPTAAPLRSI